MNIFEVTLLACVMILIIMCAILGVSEYKSIKKGNEFCESLNLTYNNNKCYTTQGQLIQTFPIREINGTSYLEVRR